MVITTLLVSNPGFMTVLTSVLHPGTPACGRLARCPRVGRGLRPLLVNVSFEASWDPEKRAEMTLLAVLCSFDESLLRRSAFQAF